MTGNCSASETSLVGHDRVCERMQSILRMAKAKGYTDDALEELCGVKARAIKSYRVEGKEPPIAAALSIACALGPWALNSLLSLIGYAARPLDDSDELQVNMMVANGLQHFTVIAAAAADGLIDHTERPFCRAAADQLIATVLPLSSAGEAA